MTYGIMDFAVAERGGGGACDAGQRIPTGRYPVYARSQVAAIAIGDTSTTIEFEAPRDLLLNELSVTARTSAGAAVAAKISIEYCGTKYLVESDSSNWAPCCDRKPWFLVGVREDKKLTVQVELYEANAAEVQVTASVAGFQGTGCCG